LKGNALERASQFHKARKSVTVARRCLRKRGAGKRFSAEASSEVYGCVFIAWKIPLKNGK
jgi:hypothetical protein